MTRERAVGAVMLALACAALACTPAHAASGPRDAARATLHRAGYAAYELQEPDRCGGGRREGWRFLGWQSGEWSKGRVCCYPRGERWSCWIKVTQPK